jgi:hypothetical protein
MHGRFGREDSFLKTGIDTIVLHRIKDAVSFNKSKLFMEGNFS